MLAIIKPDGALDVCLCFEFTHLLATASHLVPRDSLIAITMVSIRLHNQGTCGADLYPMNQLAINA